MLNHAADVEHKSSLNGRVILTFLESAVRLDARQLIRLTSSDFSRDAPLFRCPETGILVFDHCLVIGQTINEQGQNKLLLNVRDGEGLGLWISRGCGNIEFAFL